MTPIQVITGKLQLSLMINSQYKPKRKRKIQNNYDLSSNYSSNKLPKKININPKFSDLEMKVNALRKK